MTDYQMLTCAGETTRTDDRYFMVANTGAPMHLMFYDTPVVIDLAGAEFAGETLPVIYRHDSDVQLGATTSRRILGVGETQAVKDKQVTVAAIVAEWQFTNTQETARGIKENLDNGFPFQVSIGAQPLEMERVAENETAIVNGKEYKGKLLIARKSLIKELSVVVFGADRFTSTIKAQENGGITMSNIDNPVPEIPKIEGAEPTQVMAPPVLPDMNAMQEQMRVLSIETIANTISAAGTVGEIELEGGVIFRSIEAAETYAKKTPSVSADAFKKAMLDASRKRPVGPVAPGIHMQSHDVTSAVMECAILKSVAREAGIPLVATTAKDGTRYGLEAWFDERTLEDITETLFSKDHPVLSYKTGKDNEIRYQTMDNDVKGRLRPISTPYLDNSAINQTIFKDDDRTFPNQSTTQYFVTCDPNSAEGAAFYIPCLHGNINPHVEAYDFGAGMLGTGVQVYADFNVVP